MHQYTIEELVDWLKDGIAWWVLSQTPLYYLMRAPDQPPGWWYNWWSWSDWLNSQDANHHPYSVLGWRYMTAVYRLLDQYISEIAVWFVNAAKRVIAALIGELPIWASTVARGLGALFDRIGSGFVFWASDVVNALSRLFAWLPYEITYAGLSWATLFESLRGSVRAWVVAAYALTVENATNAWFWIMHSGATLAAWYAATSAWLSDLRANFVSRVINSLGATWTRLASFERDALTFWYEMWSVHASALSAFLADPGAWIVARIAAEINRIW